MNQNKWKFVFEQIQFCGTPMAENKESMKSPGQIKFSNASCALHMLVIKQAARIKNYGMSTLESFSFQTITLTHTHKISIWIQW